MPRRPASFGLCLALTTSLFGCAQAPEAREEGTEVAVHPVYGALISDQEHSDGTHGFFFLPPMVPNVPFGAPFDAGLPVVVKIDEVSLAGATLASIATYTTSTGPGGVTVQTGTDHYQVQWHTDQFGLSATKIYRIRVLVDGRELGFADVDVVNGGKELKNVATNEYIPLLNGRTLPIKFRIEEGVIDGGTDGDGDGVSDDDDNCPTTANTSQLDTDGDNVGDACECDGVVCSAQDQCHVAGACESTTGACSSPAATDGTSCNDGNADTVSDVCTNGACAGSDLCAGVVCSAQDQCHVAGVCDHATGACSNPAATDGTSCNDGNADTVSDLCTNGACAGTDLCAGVVCSASDQCHVAGVCDHATGQCSNPAAADGTSCNEGDACTQTDVCGAGVCLGTNPVVCTAQDQCHDAGVCDPSTGACTNPESDAGTACDDGNACTQTDACDAGSCVGTNPVVCTALDQCHDAGLCATDTGLCSNPEKAYGSLCDDADACTQSDICDAGACTGGNPIVCTAQDQCHDAGTCDSAIGTCSNPNALDGSSCSDADACTQADSCEQGVCTGDDPVVCTAQDQCHVAGTCDSGTGSCSNPTQDDGFACSDGDGCTAVDTCQAGTCAGSGAVCYPGVACTDDPPPSSSFTCGVCPTGYVGNGISCTDFDACAASPCFPGVTCTDQPAPALGFSCGACPAGYRGDGITCAIIPGCEANPCLPGTTCTDLTPPVYSCSVCTGPSCPTLTAQAGPDRSAATGAHVLLMGGATGNNGAITCRWTNSANATVLTTCTIDVIASGSITYTLQVTDASGLTATDGAIVSALPVVADAGPDRNITAGQSTQIVGGFQGASCGNASCIQCQWTLSDGSVVASTCTATVSPAVTTQYFLRITDTGSGAVANDSMSVFVTDAKAQLCGWNVVMYRQNAYPSAGAPNYVCDATGQARVQTVNGNPAIVLSDLVVGNTRIVGHIGVFTTGDDDLIGFVWGWQNPLHHYWLGWKQSNQNLGGLCGNALSGISVKKVDVATGATTITGTLLGFPATDYTFRCGLTWSTDRNQTSLNDPGTVFLKSPNDATAFTTGWVDNRWYRFEFYYTATQTKVFVYWDQDKVAQPTDPLIHSFVVQDSSYPEGKFAFFSNSQAQVNFGDFTLASLDAYEAHAGADVSVPPGTPIALTGTATLAVPPHSCEWQANGSTVATSCDTTVSPLLSTTYELAVTDAFGRVAVDDVTISVP